MPKKNLLGIHLIKHIREQLHPRKIEEEPKRRDQCNHQTSDNLSMRNRNLPQEIIIER